VTYCHRPTCPGHDLIDGRPPACPCPGLTGGVCPGHRSGFSGGAYRCSPPRPAPTRGARFVSALLGVALIVILLGALYAVLTAANTGQGPSCEHLTADACAAAWDQYDQDRP
jgi:hypothetical protein